MELFDKRKLYLPSATLLILGKIKFIRKKSALRHRDVRKKHPFAFSWLIFTINQSTTVRPMMCDTEKKVNKQNEFHEILMPMDTLPEPQTLTWEED